MWLNGQRVQHGSTADLIFSVPELVSYASQILTLEPGDVLLMTANAYEPSRTLANGILKTIGVETRWFDPTDIAGFEAAICERTAAVLLESPGSLTIDVQDVPAIAAICRDRGITSIIDNTWASPLFCQPLALGADAVSFGRPTLYSLAAGGEKGVDRMLTIMREELERDLALVGCAKVQDLNESFVRIRA